MNLKTIFIKYNIGIRDVRGIKFVCDILKNNLRDCLSIDDIEDYDSLSIFYIIANCWRTELTYSQAKSITNCLDRFIRLRSFS